MLPRNYPIFQKMAVIWPRTPTFAKFNSFANFAPLMTNDGALESWHQGEFVLGLLAGFRGLTRNKLLISCKQKVCKLSVRQQKSEFCCEDEYPWLQARTDVSTNLGFPPKNLNQNLSAKSYS